MGFVLGCSNWGLMLYTHSTITLFITSGMVHVCWEHAPLYPAWHIGAGTHSIAWPRVTLHTLHMHQDMGG